MSQTEPLDEFVHRLLAAGKYDVDIDTGVVTGKSGKPLTSFLNSHGYYAVNLVETRKHVRRVTVHRMIAIKRYGPAVVKGKQIAHLDSNRVHNNHRNLGVLTAKEHVTYDGTDRNLTYRNKPKAAWLACVRCGQSDGTVTSPGKTPDRISGARFGIDGSLCRRCYGTLQERARRRLRP